MVAGILCESAADWMPRFTVSNQTASKRTAPQKLDTQLIKVPFFMGSPKFSLELWLAAVHQYLSGKDGFRQAAAHFGIGRTALRR